ncbi:hypothetical protein Bxe_A1454 [Paraburkholderia xenovorans LB400]|uniref:Uncharacterized protein n=1 Tax=Paraburkholderia xenovorans (strain LB400) TaxID=266265 RepID=Q13WN9_PARXL|nr:hypothetical protein Bxe_A1454 [Paraburkholderia xenovorans LB400]
MFAASITRGSDSGDRCEHEARVTYKYACHEAFMKYDAYHPSSEVRRVPPSSRKKTRRGSSPRRALPIPHARRCKAPAVCFL